MMVRCKAIVFPPDDLSDDSAISWESDYEAELIVGKMKEIQETINSLR